MFFRLFLSFVRSFSVVYFIMGNKQSSDSKKPPAGHTEAEDEGVKVKKVQDVESDPPPKSEDTKVKVHASAHKSELLQFSHFKVQSERDI